jgi:hypothetical protein
MAKGRRRRQRAEPELLADRGPDEIGGNGAETRRIHRHTRCQHQLRDQQWGRQHQQDADRGAQTWQGTTNGLPRRRRFYREGQRGDHRGTDHHDQREFFADTQLCRRHHPEIPGGATLRTRSSPQQIFGQHEHDRDQAGEDEIEMTQQMPAHVRVEGEEQPTDRGGPRSAHVTPQPPEPGQSRQSGTERDQDREAQ